MRDLKNKKFILISVFIDIVLLVMSFLIARNIVFKEFFPDHSYFALPLIGLSIIWFTICVVQDLYDNSKSLYTHNVLSKNTYGLFLFFAVSATFIFLVIEHKFSRAFFVWFSSIYSIVVLCCRAALFLVEKNYRIKGISLKKVVVLGEGAKIEEILTKVYNNPLLGFQLKALFSDHKIKKNINELPIKTGGLKEAENYISETKVDLILIALENQQSVFIKKILNFADNNLIRIHIIPEFSDYFSRRFSIDYYHRIPVLNLRNEPLQKLSNRILKRWLDIILSLLTIIFIFPFLFPIVIIAIKLTSEGPVFFVQERTGLEGKVFNCYKFRTMTVNTQSDSVQTVKNDARVTKLGQILRKTSIDELPQVFNILKNQMSYVGPRPHMLKHTEEYRSLINQFMVRHYAKPGLTGWAQINGYRGETKELIDMQNRAEADIWYIENWSFFLDLKIIYETFYMVLFKKEENAY